MCRPAEAFTYFVGRPGRGGYRRTLYLCSARAIDTRKEIESERTNRLDELLLDLIEHGTSLYKDVLSYWTPQMINGRSPLGPSPGI